MWYYVFPKPHKLAIIRRMRFLRTSPAARRFVAVLALLGLGGLAQDVYAWEIMGGVPAVVCCCGERMTDECEMEGHCVGRDPTPSGTHDCCMVTEAGSELAVTSAASMQRVALLDAPQPPPVLLDTWISLIIPREQFSRIPFSPAHSSPAGSGAITYLLTLRLRV